MGRSCKISPCTSLFLAGETLGRCSIDHSTDIGLEGSQRYGTTLDSTESVYELIEADLLEAEAAGFPMTDGSGLASQAAVKSLLAKVYLTMAGQPLNKGAEYYQKAAAKAKEVIDYAIANPGKSQHSSRIIMIFTILQRKMFWNIFL